MVCYLPKKYFLLTLFLLSLVRLSATPDCPIITGRFNGLTDGTTVNNNSTGWYIDASQVASSGYFAVKSSRFHAQELGGQGIWYSRVFSTAGITGFQVAVKVTAEGDMNSSEYVRIYYKINGGAEILLDQRTGNFGTIDFISPTLNGNNVQLVVKIYNYNNGGSQTSKYYVEEYRVFKEHGPCSGGSSITVTATAGNGGMLTCSNPSLTISASSSASGTTYSWTGPGGFTSTSQNPVVTVPGTYNVTGTSASGSGSANVTVTENKISPDVSATGGALACASSVTLNAISSVSGVTYSWTGPGGFTSSNRTPSVNNAGSYTVTVTNPANGCTASQTVQVTAGTTLPVSIWNENFSLPDSTITDNGTTGWTTQNTGAGMFAVKTNEFKISNVGAAAEGTWTSGSINISGKTNVAISVDIRSGVTGGGALENSGSSLDYIRLYYKINGGAEILFGERLGTINSNSSTATIINIASLAGSDLQVVIRARTTASDEIYFFDNVQVTGVNGAATTINTSASGAVTCNTPAQLFATPVGGSATAWSWTGPNGFTSSQQNPQVTSGGLYIVTATLTDGCTTSAPLSVAENKMAPDIIATGGSLICMPSATLNVHSTVAAATYSWTGPGGFTSTSQNPVVAAAGTYVATVTNPANGCTSAESVLVTAGAAATNFWVENFTAANGTTADNGATSWTLQNTGTGTFSVQNNELMVSFGSANEGTWLSGIIDISSKSNVVISTLLRSSTASDDDYLENDDYIQVYYRLNDGPETLIYGDVAGLNGINNGSSSLTAVSSPLNGNTLQIIIKARNSHSTERYFFDNVQLTGAENTSVDAEASANGALTCNNTQVLLSGGSSSAGAAFNWSGPGGFISSAQNPLVTAAGIYTLTVTSTAGCTGSDTTLVTGNSVAPQNVNIALTPGTGALTCLDSTVSITGSSSTSGVAYAWSGPNGFTASIANITVASPGSYTLVVTDAANGCTDTAVTNITQDKSQPDGVTASFSNELNCYFDSTVLTGTSTTPGVSYSWTGPGGFTASSAIVSVNVPGPYTLTVTKPGNGCFAIVTTTIVENKIAPADVSATNDGPLTCTVLSVTISGSSSTPGMDYFWTGPNDFLGFSTEELVSEPGEYILTVTNLENGCTTSDTTEVLLNCSNEFTTSMRGDTINNKGVSNANASLPFEYRAWPNPFRDQAMIEFRSREAAKVSVGIYNATGRCEKVLFNNIVQPNQFYRSPISGNGLRAGVYFCIINVNGKIHSRKLILVK